MTAIDYDGLGRWGFKWQGHDHGTHVPMTDGYWTPWHEAATAIQTLRAEVERTKYDGIHTCHDQCQRTACVLRRELALVRGLLDDECVLHDETVTACRAEVERMLNEGYGDAALIDFQIQQIATLHAELADTKARLAEADKLMRELIRNQGNGVWWANGIRAFLAKQEPSQ